jgi:chemotaxis protein MotA
MNARQNDLRYTNNAPSASQKAVLSTSKPKAGVGTMPSGLPSLYIPSSERQMDIATLWGLLAAIGVIAGGMMWGQSNSSFFDIPSVLIVVLGTIATTTVAYTVDEVRNLGNIILQSAFLSNKTPKESVRVLLDIAVIVRKHGVFALSRYEKEFKKDAFLAKAMQYIIDGMRPAEIQLLLSTEIEAQLDRHQRCTSMLKRAAEIAPAMGLIGTLVGLVQMLSQLSTPEAIGPAMAVALLTTFYGAILGTVILSPLAAKLDRNSYQEAMIKTLIVKACPIIMAQENPRHLETLLNSELPPQDRLRYFD